MYLATAFFFGCIFFYCQLWNILSTIIQVVGIERLCKLSVSSFNFVLLIWITDLYPVMDHSLPVQAVVRILGLCKLSLFLILTNNSLLVFFWNFVLVQLSCSFYIANFASRIGHSLWCKLSLFLFDLHCCNRSALLVLFHGGKFNPVNRGFELENFFLSFTHNL